MIAHYLSVVPTLTPIGPYAYYFIANKIPFLIFTQFKETVMYFTPTVQIHCLTLTVALVTMNNTCYMRLLIEISEVIR
jgi:hypothetical protein